MSKINTKVKGKKDERVDSHRKTLKLYYIEKDKNTISNRFNITKFLQQLRKKLKTSDVGNGKYSRKIQLEKKQLVDQKWKQIGAVTASVVKVMSNHLVSIFFISKFV